MNVIEIPIEKIEIGPSQSRVRQIETDIDELATNIDKIGLLEPIVVFERDGQYELLTGQRRLLAVQSLGWTKIPAVIRDRPKNEAMAKAISLAENFVRRELNSKDLLEACTQLYRFYGSIKAVSEETGLKYSKVAEYVKFDRLVKPLKEAVESAQVKMDVALKAQNAATAPDGTIDEDKAVKFAAAMKTMGGSQRRTLVKASENDPTKSADEIIEGARKPPQQVKMNVTLLQNTAQSLDQFAKDEDSTREEAAVDLIVSGLEQKGY